MKRKTFRLRSPSYAIENMDVPPGKEEVCWGDLKEMVEHTTVSRLHSFRLQVNFKREPKKEKSK